MKQNLYLVRDIQYSPIYFHQSTNIFFNKIWRYDYFNGAVKCILMPLQDLEKVRRFQSRKNIKWINIWIKQIVDWGIRELVKLCHELFTDLGWLGISEFIIFITTNCAIVQSANRDSSLQDLYSNWLWLSMSRNYLWSFKLPHHILSDGFEEKTTTNKQVKQLHKTVL